MGIYHLLQYNIHRNLPDSMKNSIFLLSSIFEQYVILKRCRCLQSLLGCDKRL